MEKFETFNRFFQDNTVSMGIDDDLSKKIEDLWNSYKLPELKENCTIICADFGILGSLTIREIESFDEPVIFKYKDGSYDYISVKASRKVILWTDYQNIEPYNRQGGLYADGSTFKSLILVSNNESYREFVSKPSNYYGNISFGVWGYRYNPYWKSVAFGICIETSKVEEFINKLRKLLDK